MKRILLALLITLAAVALVAGVVGADPKPPGGGDTTTGISDPGR